jgi:ankyrin repeat protein
MLDAAVFGKVSIVKNVLKCCKEKCADSELFRNTSLVFAAISGNVAVVRLLLEGGANVDSDYRLRSTALHHAASNGRLAVCCLLLDWGAKVDPLDKWKNTPLHDAAEYGHLSVVKLLVEREADVSLRNEGGWTASDVARIWGKKDVADWLDSVSRR